MEQKLQKAPKCRLGLDLTASAAAEARQATKKKAYRVDSFLIATKVTQAKAGVTEAVAAVAAGAAGAATASA